MQPIHFHHGFHFDPRHGYDFNRLLTVTPPPGPPDFADFWQTLFQRSQAVAIAPVQREVHSHSPDFRIFEIEFTSVEQFRVRGWLTIPRHEPIERGVVVGHGYGGRDGPDLRLPMRRAAGLFACARGMSRSRSPAIPEDPPRHVLYGIQNRYAYIFGLCAADLVWCAASALIALYPSTAQRLDYMGISFGGGIGALALPWDPRFQRGHLNVPSFGHHPLRLTLPCIGSGESVRRYHQRYGGTLEVLQYFDAATAATHLHIPMHIAPALFDPAVPPPGQFAIYNALPGSKELFPLQAGHFDHAGTASENDRLWQSLIRYFQ